MQAMRQLVHPESTNAFVQPSLAACSVHITQLRVNPPTSLRPTHSAEAEPTCQHADTTYLYCAMCCAQYNITKMCTIEVIP